MAADPSPRDARNPHNDRAGRGELTGIYRVNAAALDYWRHQLATAKTAERYLTTRGIQLAALADTYSIGYARLNWTALTEHLHQAGFTDTDLLAAGLSARARTGSLIDRFRGRVIFPIHDRHGITGFTGRDLGLSSDAPRYLNTPTTAAFHKGQLLYGLEGIRPHTQQLVLVEGPIDALAIAQAARHASHPELLPLASCGTALTHHHAAQIAAWSLLHHSPQPVLAYDANQAGRNATLRAGQLLRDAGLSPLVAPVPDTLDPAAHLATHPRELDPYLPAPQGTAHHFAATVTAAIIDHWHSCRRPEEAATKAGIVNAITDHLRSYHPDQIAAAAGIAFTIAAAKAGIDTQSLTYAAQDLARDMDPGSPPALATIATVEL